MAASFPTALRALPLALLLAGCLPPDFRIVDQRTFRSAPATPAPEAVTQAALPPLPLVVIRFDQPDLDYRPALAEAVTLAQAHNPQAVFEVLTPVPTSANTEVQRQYLTQGAADARDVARALAADAVDPDRVQIGYRADPGAPVREVRIYVR